MSGPSETGDDRALRRRREGHPYARISRALSFDRAVDAQQPSVDHMDRARHLNTVERVRGHAHHDA